MGGGENIKKALWQIAAASAQGWCGSRKKYSRQMASSGVGHSGD
jgi:hypothetical protein